MRNIKLTIEYDGTNYCGWQVQPNGVTVQETLQKALSKMTGKRTLLQGASRTDAGVHALGQVANFRTDSKIACRGFVMGLNSLLPDDITVRDAEEVAEDFHAKRSSVGKHYRYLIMTGDTRPAVFRDRVWFVKDVAQDWKGSVVPVGSVAPAFRLGKGIDRVVPVFRPGGGIDRVVPVFRPGKGTRPEGRDYRSSREYISDRDRVKEMNRAARALIGEHDFSAFCGAGDSNRSKVRRIEKIEVRSRKYEVGSSAEFLTSYFSPPTSVLLSIDITGNGFLKYMVRNIVGTLVSNMTRPEGRDYGSSNVVPVGSVALAGSVVPVFRPGDGVDRVVPVFRPGKGTRPEGRDYTVGEVARPEGRDYTVGEVARPEGRDYISGRDYIKYVLDSKDRKKAGVTAPAHGLYLVRVLY